MGPKSIGSGRGAPVANHLLAQEVRATYRAPLRCALWHGGKGGWKEVGYSLKQNATTEALRRRNLSAPRKGTGASHSLEVKRGSHLKNAARSWAKPNSNLCWMSNVMKERLHM